MSQTHFNKRALRGTRELIDNEDKAKTKIETKTITETKSKTETKIKTETKRKTETKTKTETKSKTETKTKPKNETEDNIYARIKFKCTECNETIRSKIALTTQS